MGEAMETRHILERVSVVAAYHRSLADERQFPTLRVVVIAARSMDFITLAQCFLVHAFFSYQSPILVPKQAVTP